MSLHGDSVGIPFHGRGDDLFAVYVRDETVIVIDIQIKRIEAINSFERELLADVDSGIVIPHVVKDRLVVGITVAKPCPTRFP